MKKRNRAKKGAYVAGSAKGYAVQIRDAGCLEILKENKLNGIAHSSTCELAVAEFFGIEFKLNSSSRRPVVLDDYNRKGGVIVAIKSPEIISALINHRQTTGVSPAYIVEKSVNQKYGAKAS